MGLSRNPIISGVATHNMLQGRTSPDTHPKTAITGLDSQLNTIELTLSNLASGGVASFNGRTGAIVPVATDYTPAFIGAAEAEHNHNTAYYTKAEVDNQHATIISGTDWKESVNTFADIATTYPTPEDGWTVNVKDTDYTYRYSGSSWVAISANSIPKATNSIDGLMSKEDKTKLDGIGGGGGALTKVDYSATLQSASWAGASAPFTYTLTIAGVLATDRPEIIPDYSATLATALLEKTAYSCIDEVEATAADTIVFRAFETKPTQNLNIVVEVLRNG